LKSRYSNEWLEANPSLFIWICLAGLGLESGGFWIVFHKATRPLPHEALALSAPAHLGRKHIDGEFAGKGINESGIG
jgi:hypothetical protein